MHAQQLHCGCRLRAKSQITAELIFGNRLQNKVLTEAAHALLSDDAMTLPHLAYKSNMAWSVDLGMHTSSKGLSPALPAAISVR